MVTREKVAGYLLSWTHPSGRSKADFFYRYGFRAEQWTALARALIKHASSYDVAKVEETPFGMRYTIDGELETPDRRNPQVRVVWFVGHGETAPRLVTAYPC